MKLPTPFLYLTMLEGLRSSLAAGLKGVSPRSSNPPDSAHAQELPPSHSGLMSGAYQPYSAPPRLSRVARA